MLKEKETKTGSRTFADGLNKNCYEIILNYNCNARCLFCSQGSFDKSLNADFSDIVRNIYLAYKSGYRRLGLTGGEPLLREDIIKIISVAKSVGFKFIRIQTNGIKLHDMKFCKELVKAGLTFCKFSFISDKPRIHDELMQVPGSWEKAITGLENLKSLKIRLGNNVLINKFNYSNLHEMIGFFLKKGISNFVIIYPLYIGSMAKNYAKVGVPLYEVSEHFLKSIKLMEKTGLANEILFLNVPPCFLPGYEDIVIGFERFNTIVTEPTGRKIDLDYDSNKNKIYGKPCRKCALKTRCGGVDLNYISFWGWKGFKPLKKIVKPSGVHTNGKQKELFLSDNEKCMMEILKKEPVATTQRILELSKSIPLCQDCRDGNAVINAGESLIKRNIIKKVFRNGQYFWMFK